MQLFALEQLLRNKGLINKSLLLGNTVTGGSINYCCRLTAGTEQFFLKWNDAEKHPDMLAVEARGLDLLRSSDTITIPEVVTSGTIENDQYLLLRWIDKGTNTSTAQEKLGQQLAMLHKTTNSYFGLDHNNYMGSLTQLNEPEKDCATFFTNKRILPQLQIGVDNKMIDRHLLGKFEKLFLRLNHLIPVEQPALTHGDLWNGNYMIDTSGNPVLIDPAVSYHHRETDIALTSLFGGFSPYFYDAYNEVYPLQPGWQQRVDLWNLYPLLIHINLFGYSYVQQLEESIDQLL